MIFNKNKNGAKELRELTGSYYANNSFSKISGDIEVATEELTVLIGERLCSWLKNIIRTERIMNW